MPSPSGNYSSDLDRLREKGNAAGVKAMLEKAARETATVQNRSASAAQLNLGMPIGSDLDAAKMAADEFAPQYQLLNQLRQQANSKYTTAGKEIGGMYDSLAKATLGQEAGIKQNYAAAGSKIGGAFNDAINQTNKSFSGSRNDIAEIAKRLGVQAGVPSALSEGAEQQSRLVGLLGANKANTEGVNTLLGNNDVAYNRDTANTTKLAGANARTDIKNRLLDILAGYGNKELELKAGQSEAANKYGLSIKDMMQQAQLAREKMAMEASSKSQSDELNRARLMLDQAKYGLENDKFLASQGNAASKASSPYELLAQTASKLYGNDVAATNASKAIEDTFTRGYNGDQSWNNAADFINDVMRRNPRSMGVGGDSRQLQQLALQFYTALAGGANKSFNGPLGS